MLMSTDAHTRKRAEIAIDIGRILVALGLLAVLASFDEADRQNAAPVTLTKSS